MTLYEEALMMLDEVRLRALAMYPVDEAIEELIIEAVKRLQADHDALVAEHADLERLLVTQTTKAENGRIDAVHHNQRVTWVNRP